MSHTKRKSEKDENPAETKKSRPDASATAVAVEAKPVITPSMAERQAKWIYDKLFETLHVKDDPRGVPVPPLLDLIAKYAVDRPIGELWYGENGSFVGAGVYPSGRMVIAKGDCLISITPELKHAGLWPVKGGDIKTMAFNRHTSAMVYSQETPTGIAISEVSEDASERAVATYQLHPPNTPHVLAFTGRGITVIEDWMVTILSRLPAKIKVDTLEQSGCDACGVASLHPADQKTHAIYIAREVPGPVSMEYAIDRIHNTDELPRRPTKTVMTSMHRITAMTSTPSGHLAFAVKSVVGLGMDCLYYVNPVQETVLRFGISDAIQPLITGRSWDEMNFDSILSLAVHSVRRSLIVVSEGSISEVPLPDLFFVAPNA